MNEITAVYYANSFFDIDFELKDVHDWWIKWDVLYVIHKDGDEPVEYEPCASAINDHEYIKRPIEVYVNGQIL